MGSKLELPAQFEGPFSIHLYWVSHGLLLLRSVNRNSRPKRVELLFQDTLWISLPAWLHGVEIEGCSIEPLLAQLPSSLHDEARLRRAFEVRSEKTVHHVIAGSVWSSQDDELYFADSALLPDIRVVIAWPET
jgi:hypothetical protein